MRYVALWVTVAQLVGLLGAAGPEAALALGVRLLPRLRLAVGPRRVANALSSPRRECPLVAQPAGTPRSSSGYRDHRNGR